VEKKIQTLILDLGGVIFDLDYMATPRAFEALGVKSFETAFSKAKQHQLFDLFEKGLITESAFYEGIRNFTGTELDDHQIEQAWNAMLLGIPHQRFDLLRKLAGKFRLFLLSNTNEIHIRNFSNELQQRYGSHLLEDIFLKCYYSSRMGMRKPDKEIFERVLHENHIDRSGALFIDDSPQHARGAIMAGLPALHLELEKGDSLEQMCGRLFPDILS
jgi:FMN phosphatase YigB (HAD superfamily)